MSLMMNNNQLLLSLLFICSVALLSVQSQAAPMKCKPSEFWSKTDPFDPSSYKCVPCSTGYYCPDGNNEYYCPEGTISPERGAVTCKPCSNNSTGSDITRTACFLPDTPKDIQTFHNNAIENITVTAQQPLYFYVKPANLQGLFFTLYFAAPGKEYPVTIFGSSVTGRPTPLHFEMVSSSIRPQFLLKDYHDQLLYFSLVTPFNGIIYCYNCI